jgi:hypothetical protein
VQPRSGARSGAEGALPSATRDPAKMRHFFAGCPERGPTPGASRAGDLSEAGGRPRYRTSGQPPSAIGRNASSPGTVRTRR